jgi:anti-anti-sigma regulatory factor
LRTQITDVRRRRSIEFPAPEFRSAVEHRPSLSHWTGSPSDTQAPHGTAMKLESERSAEGSQHPFRPHRGPALELHVEGLTLTARLALTANLAGQLKLIRSYRMPLTIVDLERVDGLTADDVEALVDLWRSLRKRACEVRVVATSGEVRESIARHKLGIVLPVFASVSAAKSAPAERAAS